MLATTVIFLKQDPSVANVNNVMYWGARTILTKYSQRWTLV
jgi:hypothetical protein